MEKQGYGKGAFIAVILIAVLVIGFIVYNMLTNVKVDIEYYVTSGKEAQPENFVIPTYQKLKSKMSKLEINETIQSKKDFKKSDLKETFDEKFFDENVLACVVVYEDNSSTYSYSIEDITYNDTKTSATVKYKYNKGTYIEPIATAQFVYMLVALPKTVGENVVFQQVAE